MRIIFMGTPDFAVPSLEILAQAGHDIVAVITAPDRPAGRGKKLRPSAVKLAAERWGLPIWQPEKLRNPAFLQEMTDLQPDLAVVVAFRMLPKLLWSIPRLGTFNLHASLLPDYRGAAPINWVLMNGETQTGATTFFIDEQIDTGNLLLQRSLDIPYEWSAGDLHDQLMTLGAELVRDTVQGLADGQLTPKPQDEAGIQHQAPKIFKEDCLIDWTRPAQELYHFIRGLSPYPTAWTKMGDGALKVYEVAVVEEQAAEAPGTLKIDLQQGRLRVVCGTGLLDLLAIQAPGKKRLAVADFLRGRPQLPQRLG